MEIRVGRRYLGLSQANMAEKLGIHPITVSRLEKQGEEAPELYKLAVECLVFRKQGYCLPPEFQQKTDVGTVIKEMAIKYKAVLVCPGQIELVREN